MSTQADQAQTLRALHHTARPLVLVNAWDAASARIIEELGFPAVATTSAGIAWAEGFADGEHISRERMLARVEVIARAVSVPVTADLESGYGPSVRDAIDTAKGAIEAGAVGLNFEDAVGGGSELIESEHQAERITAMRQAGTEMGVALVINARTDVYLAQVGDDDAWRFAEATRRADRYLRAGADCVFIPGVADEESIAALVSAVRGPLNVLAAAATPSVRRLQELGVARVSVGSGAMGYVLAQFRDIAFAMRDGGSFEFAAQRIPHAHMNALVAAGQDEQKRATTPR
jgi:2-methylisocitrate lyase-like PEP mutase family enzyme